MRSETTRALIALEDDAPDALFARAGADGPLIWPIVRGPLALASSQVESGFNAVARRETRGQQLRRAARAWLPDRTAGTRIPRRTDVLFVVGGTTRTPTPDGYANWLVEDFAQAVNDRAAVLQDAPFDRRRTSTRPRFARTFGFAGALARVDVRTRFSPLDAASAAATDAALRDIVARYPIPIGDDEAARIARIARYRLGRLRHLDAEFERILDRVQPRIVVMDSASYGPRASLIRLLKQRGVLVAEPQHGLISPSHTAYNFGAAAWQDGLRDGLPDVLLTFGRAWERDLAHPAELVTIGKPALNTAAAARDRGRRRNEVLLVSNVFDRERLTAFARAARSAAPDDWRIVFRPHPSERGRAAELYPGIVGLPGVDLDEGADINAALAEARMVVGQYSTVLYEALAFGCVVEVIDSDLAGYHLDPTVFDSRLSSPDDLTRRIAAVAAGGITPDETVLADVWQTGSVERFAAFVEERLSGRNP